MFKFGKNKKKKPSREEIIKEAMENARKAKEELGEETIQKMAEALKKQQEQEEKDRK